MPFTTYPGFGHPAHACISTNRGVYSVKLTKANYMKKSIAIILTIFSLLLILDSLDFGHALMMFLLAGVIPGTNIAISGAQMLQVFAVIAGFTVARVMTYCINTLAPRIISTPRSHISA